MEVVPNVIISPALLPIEDLPDSMRSALEKITKRSPSRPLTDIDFNHRRSDGVACPSLTDELLPLLLFWMPTSAVRSSSTFIPTPPLPERDDSTAQLFRDVMIIPTVRITPPSPTPETIDFPSIDLALTHPSANFFDEVQDIPPARSRTRQPPDAGPASWQIARRPAYAVRKHSTRRHCMIFTDDGLALPTATSRLATRSAPSPNPVPPRLLRTYASTLTLNQTAGFPPQKSTSGKDSRWRSGSLRGLSRLTVKIGMVTKTLCGLK